MATVLVLHTGGTLGMKGTPLEPGAYASHLEEQVPELSRIADLDTRIVCNLDSSDMTPHQWSELAQIVAEERARFDGFVVIHGTDTMAYSSSALSFALSGLDRPVVFTGAQRPLAALRSDARRNLADAVEVATKDIPEVTICFDGMLLRACRATKANARDYRAFDSPGTAPLARLGVDVQLSSGIRRPTTEFAPDARFDDRVGVLQTWPGIRPHLLDAYVEAGIRGVVLAAYGVGTVPTSVGPLAPAVRRAVDAGVDVLVVTQSTGDVDLRMYKNSIPLAEAGAIEGGRMRIEAAVAKLSHAMACFDDSDARRRYLLRDVAGERDS